VAATYTNVTWYPFHAGWTKIMGALPTSGGGGGTACVTQLEHIALSVARLLCSQNVLRLLFWTHDWNMKHKKRSCQTRKQQRTERTIPGCDGRGAPAVVGLLFWELGKQIHLTARFALFIADHWASNTFARNNSLNQITSNVCGNWIQKKQRKKIYWH